MELHLGGFLLGCKCRFWLRHLIRLIINCGLRNLVNNFLDGRSLLDSRGRIFAGTATLALGGLLRGIGLGFGYWLDIGLRFGSSLLPRSSLRLVATKDKTSVGRQNIWYSGYSGHFQIRELEIERWLYGLRLALRMFVTVVVGVAILILTVVAEMHFGVVHGRLGKQRRLEALTAAATLLAGTILGLAIFWSGIGRLIIQNVVDEFLRTFAFGS